MIPRHRHLIASATIALFVLLAGTLASGADTAAGREGERAELYVPVGVHGELEEADGIVRVSILLARQPVLRSAQRPRFQQAIGMRFGQGVRARARSNPQNITAAELRSGRRAERRYESAVTALDDEAAAAKSAQRRLERKIERMGGRSVMSSTAINSITARVPAEILDELAGRGDVQAIGPAPRQRPQLDVAAGVVGAPSWWAAGHTGGGGSADIVAGDVGLLGEAVDPTHPAFASVEVTNSSLVVPDDHGTHVGGIVSASDATYPGVAPGVDKLLGAVTPEWLLGIAGDEGAGADDPAEALNSSFGATETDDRDDAQDLFAALYGVGFSGGAGNDGPSPNTVSEVGRNTLSVGAFADQNTASTADDVIATFSSRGPTLGGRKKPDLLAPGVGITAADAEWETGDDFTSVQGTSFSTPFVTGAMALLEGAGITDPKVQRALLTNSARFWPSQTHWQPDAGWGVLDLTTALAQRANFATGSVEGNGARFYRASSVPAGGKTTLAWNMRGTWDAFPECCLTAYTTTNLDLRQYVASTLAEVSPPSDPGHGGGPDAVDPNDTTEQVRAPSGGPQTMIYKVEASSTVEGAATEPFALASAQPLQALANPEVDPVNVDASPAGTVNCQTDVIVTTDLANDSSDLDAHAAQVALALPAGVQLISGSATQEVSDGVLERSTSASETHTWTVRATTSGAKQLTITGHGGTMGETFTSSDQVSFTADCSPPAVAPTGTTISPPATPACGNDQVVSTTLRNASATDAQSSEVRLDLSAGVALVSGPVVQPVSGGLLEQGTTSEQHAWTVRPAGPNLAVTITGFGSDGTQVFSYPQSVPVPCLASGGGGGAGGSGGDPAAVTLLIDRIKMRAGKLVVGGSASTASGHAPGEVTVDAKRGRRQLQKTGDLRDGRFAVKFRVCRPGRWRAVANYEGATSLAAATTPPATLRVRGGQLAC